MMSNLFKLIILLFSLSFSSLFSQESIFTKKKHVFDLSLEPIDVVIPCVEKDKECLELCIEGIRKYGKDIRRIIVISPTPLTNQAEWFDEKAFPFSKLDIAEEIFENRAKAQKFATTPSRIGWIYQQLLKLYAPLVIPGISSNVLLLDADTIFLRPVSFLNERGQALFNVGYEYHLPYFEHAERLLPGFKKIFPNFSGICHHMLIQKPILEDLFSHIEENHHCDSWRAICRCIDLKFIHESSLSEYEIYFNFVFARTKQVHLRILKWANITSLHDIPRYIAENYDYVSWHSYNRE